MFGQGMQASGASNMMNSLPGVIDSYSSVLDQKMQELQSSSAENNGMLDPMSLINIQVYIQNMTTLLTLLSSVVKQFGDLNKTIVSNTGQ